MLESVCVYLFLISKSGMCVGVACAGECVCVCVYHEVIDI